MISPNSLEEKIEEAPPTASRAETDEIEVLVANIVFGPYSKQKVQERIEEGLLTLGDLAREGQSAEWVSLKELLERTESAPPSAAAAMA